MIHVVQKAHLNPDGIRAQWRAYGPESTRSEHHSYTGPTRSKA